MLIGSPRSHRRAVQSEKILKMENDLTDLKKEQAAKPEQAKSATTKDSSDYWESAFACQTHQASTSDIADTGCSSHMFRDKARFNSLQ